MREASQTTECLWSVVLPSAPRLTSGKAILPVRHVAAPRDPESEPLKVSEMLNRLQRQQEATGGSVRWRQWEMQTL